MPRLEWTDNYAVSDVSNERRQPLGINDINQETNSIKARGEKSISLSHAAIFGWHFSRSQRDKWT
jgi:hypothetical protein